MNRLYCVQISKLTESKLYPFALVLLSSIVKLSMCECFWALSRKRWQSYGQFFNWPNFLWKKFEFLSFFSIFVASFPKASAKLGIFCELTKYFCNFFYAEKHKNFYFADIQALANRPKAAERFAAPNHVGRSRTARLPPRHRTPPRRTLRCAEAKATTRRSASASPQNPTAANAALRRTGEWDLFGRVVFFLYFCIDF